MFSNKNCLCKKGLIGELALECEGELLNAAETSLEHIYWPAIFLWKFSFLTEETICRCSWFCVGLLVSGDCDNILNSVKFLYKGFRENKIAGG